MSQSKYQYELIDQHYDALSINDTAFDKVFIEDIYIENTLEINRATLNKLTVDGLESASTILRDVTITNSEIEFFEKDEIFVENSVFENTIIKDSDLNNAILKNVTFINCEFANVDFVNTELNSVKFDHCNFINIDLTKIKAADNTILIEPTFVNSKLLPSQEMNVIKNGNSILETSELKLNSWGIVQEIVDSKDNVVPKNYFAFPGDKETLLIRDVLNNEIYKLTFQNDQLIDLFPDNKQLLKEFETTNFKVLLAEERFEKISLDNEFLTNYHRLSKLHQQLDQAYEAITHDFYEIAFDIKENEIHYSIANLYDFKDGTSYIQDMKEKYKDVYTSIERHLKKQISIDHELSDKARQLYYTVTSKNLYMEARNNQFTEQNNYLSALINHTVNDLITENKSINNSQLLFLVTTPENIQKLSYIDQPVSFELTDNLNKDLTANQFNNLLITERIKNPNELYNLLQVTYNYTVNKDARLFSKPGMQEPKFHEALRQTLEGKITSLQQEIEERNHAAEQQKSVTEVEKTYETELSR